MMRRQFCGGFTLIELMIVVVIVAILASIALPSYQSSIQKSRRTAVQAELLSLAAELERMYSRQFVYTCSSLELPSNTFYTLSCSPATGSGQIYTLQAQAIGSQLGDTSCLTLSLQHNGQRAPESCW